MSQSYSIRGSVRTGSIATTAPRSLLSRWFGTIDIWLNRRQGRQDLSELDDRLLADVGISRQDVLWEAHKPFWRSGDAFRKAGTPLQDASLAIGNSQSGRFRDHENF